MWIEISLFFFEIFTQHMDKKYLQGPTIFITFDYTFQKLLHDMFVFLNSGSLGRSEKITFFRKNKFEIDFLDYICMENFESFHFDPWVKSYEDFLFMGSYGFSTLK